MPVAKPAFPPPSLNVCRGATDVFFFPGTTTGPGGLGPLTSVCISHDDSGDSPNWQLERVEVTDTGVGKTWVFPCQAWIGKDKVGEAGYVRVVIQGDTSTHCLYFENVMACTVTAHPSMASQLDT
jgi:hypothetical protein